MKLIFCLKCQDIVRLFDQPRTCKCGLSEGYYTDAVHATYSGPCLPLGIDNTSFVRALRLPFGKVGDTGEAKRGAPFTAFVIPPDCATVIQHRGERRKALDSATKKSKVASLEEARAKRKVKT